MHDDDNDNEIPDMFIPADTPTREEILAAIRDGVSDAFLTAMSAMNHNPVPMFRDDMLDVIGEAVAASIPPKES